MPWRERDTILGAGASEPGTSLEPHCVPPHSRVVALDHTLAPVEVGVVDVDCDDRRAAIEHEVLRGAEALGRAALPLAREQDDVPLLLDHCATAALSDVLQRLREQREPGAT